MLRDKDDAAFAAAEAELHLKRAVPDGQGGYKWEGTKVLIPLREQRRREVADAALEIVTGLQARCINPDAPMRYEPPVSNPKPTPEPVYFHSGRGSKRLRQSYAARQAKKLAAYQKDNANGG